ncbi:MAG TPA: formylglycine-generating enzyme family protein, partial [Pirellulales bacterium]
QTATTSPGPTALPEIAASAESAPQFVPETAPDPTRPRQLGDDRINTLGMRLLWIPPGEFWMGSPADEAERRPEEVRRRVRLTRGFWLAKFETTQNEYEMLMGPPPSKFCAGGIHAKAVRGMNTDRFPVENVTWMEAQEFCRRLSDREKHRYRLPTEAEWEYACRAGTTTPYSFGSKCNGTEANANGNYPYGEATVGPYLARPAVVGSYPANAWGLCDMHGNVWEWCEDWYGPYAPSEQTSIDPAGVTSGDARVGRGGSWFSEPRGIRAAYRGFEHVNYRDEYLGFRLCLEE